MLSVLKSCSGCLLSFHVARVVLMYRSLCIRSTKNFNPDIYAQYVNLHMNIHSPNFWSVFRYYLECFSLLPQLLGSWHNGTTFGLNLREWPEISAHSVFICFFFGGGGRCYRRILPPARHLTAVARINIVGLQLTACALSGKGLLKLKTEGLSQTPGQRAGTRWQH